MLSQIEGVINITKKKLEDIYNQNVKTITPSSFDGDENSIFEITEDIEIYEDMTLSGINNVLISNHTITNNGLIEECRRWYFLSSKIINNGKINDCGWEIISSNTINNYIISECNFLLCVSSIMSNGKFDNCSMFMCVSNITNCIITNCTYWQIYASSITNCTITDCSYWEVSASSIIKCNIENCIDWILLASKLSNCNISDDCVDLHTTLDYIELPIIKKEDYDKLQNEYNKLKNITINNNVNVKDDKLRKLLLLSYLNQKDNSNVLQNLIK